MRRVLIGPAVAFLLGAALLPACAAAQGSAPAANGGNGGGNGTGNGGGGASKAHQPPTTGLPRGAATQDRELDQIGSKLLKETPKNPPQDNAATGGGLEPPPH